VETEAIQQTVAERTHFEAKLKVFFSLLILFSAMA